MQLSSNPSHATLSPGTCLPVRLVQGKSFQEMGSAMEAEGNMSLPGSCGRSATAEWALPPLA